MTCSLRSLAALVALSCTACSFSSTATHWHGRLDAEGRPVFLKATTNVGINLLVFIPLLGNITVDEMVEFATGSIARTKGTRVRVVQAGSINYSLAFLPFTYVITPVVTEVYIEYEPSWDELVDQLGVDEATSMRAPPEAEVGDRPATEPKRH